MLLQRMDCDYMTSLGEQVLDAAREVHAQAGAGVPKSEYLEKFARELELREVPFKRDAWQPEEVAGAPLNVGYIIDFLIDGKVVVEVISSPRTTRDDEARLLALLQLSGHKLGFSINFGMESFENAVRRLYLEDRQFQP